MLSLHWLAQPFLPKVQPMLFDNVGPTFKTKVNPILLPRVGQTSSSIFGPTTEKDAGHCYHYASWSGHWFTKLGRRFEGWFDRGPMVNTYLGIWERVRIIIIQGEAHKVLQSDSTQTIDHIQKCFSQKFQCSRRPSYWTSQFFYRWRR